MRRERALVLLLVLVGAGLVMLATAQVWEVGELHQAGLGGVRLARRGSDITAAPRALTLVALSGAGAALVTGGAARRVCGCGLLIAGLASAAAALLTPSTQEVFGATGVHTTAWPVLAAIGALLQSAGGLILAVRGGRWPGPGSRFTPPQPQAPAGPAAAPERATWDALDRGEDPTA